MICPACKSESLIVYATLAPKVGFYKSFWHNRLQCKQEPHQVAPVVVPAQFIEPPSMVPIWRAAGAQLIGERFLHGLSRGHEGCGPALMVRMPQLPRVLPQRFQPRSEVARPASFRRPSVTNRPVNMRQTFLLADVSERSGIVAAPSIGHHPPG
jgi:hypothetical protein